MSLYTLENDSLKVRVNTIGAELCSIFNRSLELEYMWQPSVDVWNHSSLFMFPNPARIKGNKALINGVYYPQCMQGFVKNMDFSVRTSTSETLVLGVKSGSFTKKWLPYVFTIDVSFSLRLDGLTETITVSNKGDSSMYFGLGLHPGFNLPLVPGESASDYKIMFDRPQTIFRHIPESETMLLSGKTASLLNNECEFRLSENMFNDGPLICGGLDADQVSLVSFRSGRSVSLSVKGFSDICFWGRPDKPQLCCIEPWVSSSDYACSDQVWEHKPGNVKLDSGDTYEVSVRYSVS